MVKRRAGKSNCQFDYWPLKVKNRPDFLVFKWQDTYCLKAIDKGYNFTLNLTLIGGLHTKLWASKVVGVSILRISRLQLGSLKRKWHLGVGLVAKHREYYKGEGGGFPQVRAVVNLMNLCLPMARPCTKNASTMH
jgi:hypothetical protein